MNIGFDLDNTLINTADNMIKLASVVLKYKLPKNWQDYDYNFSIFPKEVREFLIKTAYTDHIFLSSINPHKYVIEELKKLKKNNNIYIITARSQPSMIEMTKMFVNRHFPFINKVLFSPYKFEYINEYDMDIFVDDLYTHAVDIVKNTKAKVYVIRKFYNLNFQDEERIKFYDNIKLIFKRLQEDS